MEVKGIVVAVSPTTEEVDPAQDVVVVSVEQENNLGIRRHRMAFYSDPGMFSEREILKITVERTREL